MLLIGTFDAFAEPVIRQVVIEGHTRTRTDVIQRELLFREGERLDSLAIVETARNLRQLFFLGDVRVDVQGDSTHADVTVRVRDLYARALSPLLSGDVDELSYGMTALDYNFLGRGQNARVTLFHDAVTGNSARGRYQNPRFGGSRVALTADVEVGDEGHDVYGALAQPFYALSARWAYGVSALDRELIRRRYRGGVLTDRYVDRLSGGNAWLTRSYGDVVKVRPGVLLSVTDRRFAPEPGYAYAPSNRRRVLPSLRLTVWRPRYEARRFVRELGRTEDLQVGSWVRGSLGVSRAALGSDRNFLFYGARLAPRLRLGEDGFLFGDFWVTGRQQSGGYGDIEVGGTLSVYRQIRMVHVLAMRVRYDALVRPEDNNQLLLGLDRGLRGYVPRRFDGMRRVTINFEVRPVFRRHSDFVLGGVLFVDAGHAWTPGVDSGSLYPAMGGGVRVAFTRVYDQPILRVDVAYATRDRAWQVSFGLGHYF